MLSIPWWCRVKILPTHSSEILHYWIGFKKPLPSLYLNISKLGLFSAVPRAILEPVYRFGISNSDSQILKNIVLVLYLFNVKQKNNWSFTFPHKVLPLFSNDLSCKQSIFATPSTFFLLSFFAFRVHDNVYIHPKKPALKCLLKVRKINVWTCSVLWCLVILTT